MKKRCERNCPECSKPITYQSEWHRNKAEIIGTRCKSCGTKGKNNPLYGKVHSKKTMDSIIQKNKDFYASRSPEEQKEICSRFPDSKGCNNPMYGVTVYEKWVEKYGKEVADTKMNELRRKKSIQSSGEGNPMFGKPSPRGSGNGWKGWLNGHFFRSLKELSFLLFLESKKLEWSTGEDKNTKIQYKDWNNQTRNYFPDFVVGNKIYEIKPKKLWETPSVKLKKEAAEKFCAERGMEYFLIDIETNSDLIYKKYILKEIIWQGNYEEKFLEFISKNN